MVTTSNGIQTKGEALARLDAVYVEEGLLLDRFRYIQEVAPIHQEAELYAEAHSEWVALRAERRELEAFYTDLTLQRGLSKWVAR
jgi:hypothetical protein